MIIKNKNKELKKPIQKYIFDSSSSSSSDSDLEWIIF